MGVAELKKAELYYHRSVQEDVAKILQHSGSCQIIGETKDANTGAGPADIAARLNACEEQQGHIRYLFRSIGSYYTDPVSSLDRLLGEKPVLSVTELAQTAEKTDLGELVLSVKKTEAALNELRLEISQLKANASILSHIKDFPYSLSILGEGTRTLKGIFGSLSAGQAEIFKSALAAEFSAESEIYISPGTSGNREAWVVVMYARTHEHQILELCGRSGMSFVELPSDIRGTVTEENAKIASRLIESERQEARLIQELKDSAQEYMPVIQQLSDYWSILCERYRALGLSNATERTIRTDFWIPTEAAPVLQKQLEALSPNLALVLSDPGEEDNPPTLLRNHPLARPAEVLTNLYSPPAYGDIDPTPLFAPFFFLFFGMCLGDAGYAIVIGSILWMLFRKYRRIPSNVSNFIHIFSIGAVVTFFYGAVTGSFFGDFIDVFFFMAPLRALKNAVFVIDPMADPMAVLGLALTLGTIHLMFGLSIAAYDEYRKGNYVDAIGGKVSWILFVLGLIFVGAGAAGVLHPALYFLSKCMAALGALIIFWYAGRDSKNIFLKIGSGLYALYGCTSYLGDILSYSRLLALGLGSAVIGAIINLLGMMAAGIPYVGWALALLIVVGGHIFGIAVNLLGAFVHSLRLQYVEFFSKFYSGGGSVFKPLTLSTQYIEISD